MAGSGAGRFAIVTGGGSGIGRASAIALAAEGYGVAIAGRRAAELEATRKEAGDAGAHILAIPTDVTDEVSVIELFSRAKAKFGRLDVVFNNAGIGLPPSSIADISFADWKRVVDVNLNGMFLVAREAARQMRAQSPKGGRIINNGSISAHAPRPGSIAYTTTKHAVTGLTKTIALDGRADDIACSQIDIGNAATPMTERMAKGVPQATGEIKAEPTMDVAHVASAIVYMAGLPLDANVLTMTVMASKMPFVGRG